jgi:hypothetical protein
MSTVRNYGYYISGIDSNNTTALPSDLLSGKTAISKGSGSTELITGTMTDNGTAAVTNSLGINGTYTYNIPQGHYNGGTVTVNQSIATKAAQTYYFSNVNQTIASGQYLSGAQTIKGVAFLGAQTFTPTTYNQTIPAGYYLSGDQTILGSSNLVSSNIASDVSIFNVTGSIHRYSGDQTVFNYGTYGSFLRWGVSYHMQNYESTASTYCRLENDHIYTKTYNTSTTEQYAYILSNRSFRFDQFSKIRITYTADGTDSEGYGRTSYIRVYMTASDGSWRVGGGSQENTGGMQIIESSLTDYAGNPLGSKQARLEIDVGHTEGRYPWVVCNIYKIEFLV